MHKTFYQQLINTSKHISPLTTATDSASTPEARHQPIFGRFIVLIGAPVEHHEAYDCDRKRERFLYLHLFTYSNQSSLIF